MLIILFEFYFFMCECCKITVFDVQKLMSYLISTQMKSTKVQTLGTI